MVCIDKTMKDFIETLQVGAMFLWIWIKFIPSYAFVVLLVSLFIYVVGKDDISILSNYTNCVRVTVIFTCLMAGQVIIGSYLKRLFK